MMSSNDISRINFINILRAALAHTDPESAKNTVKPLVFFALLESGRVIASHKMLMKLKPGREVSMAWAEEVTVAIKTTPLVRRAKVILI